VSINWGCAQNILCFHTIIRSAADCPSIHQADIHFFVKIINGYNQLSTNEPVAKLSSPLLRYITILSSEDNGGDSESSVDDDDGLDLRTLRAIRVLRPLKLVSGVPSKFWCLKQYTGIHVFYTFYFHAWVL